MATIDFGFGPACPFYQNLTLSVFFFSFLLFFYYFIINGYNR